MTVINIIFRVEEICKKYDKYDVDKQRELGASGDDAFSRLFNSIDTDIESVVHKAELASTETNRAAAVALNAEVRRTKARLAEDVVKLQKLAVKKVKGLTKEERESRCDLVIALADRIQVIPDGHERQANNEWGGASAPNKNIKFDISEEDMDDEFFQQTEESSQFRQEYEMRRKKQDEGLDVISEGLDALKNLARDMNEELDKQVPLMDEMETKVDGATSDLKNTNVRLKQQLVKMRSSRNFCIDIILLCVVLGIISYIYNALN
ncbi:PREDICTED: syntaxin-72 isoform X1 [Brassica oleracea var. oleracea]|uniref:syntaxin-72 isoform X1 n=1 Tax=Brassica oleracea var. oleracea TaxID=109376 RepID=UPI0006A6DD21|nr:PREDICTED: syntaxin-72 isoform X1 [Brassica oleracea var. oleracea]